MTPTSVRLDATSSYSGNEYIVFGNGHSAPISHIGRSHISPTISLLDVLVVPKLTKSLLSVSKLTQDNQVDVVFSGPMFFIMNRHSKETLAQGRRRNGLYVLEQGQQAFFFHSLPDALKPFLIYGIVDWVMFPMTFFLF